MSLDEVLNTGLETIPGCKSLCYVDLPTRLVLVSKSHKPQPQEVYDRIAGKARQMFQGQGITSVIPAEADARRLFFFHKSEVQVFTQPVGDPEHALCCVCDATADLAVIAEQLETTGARFAEAFQ